MNMSYFSDSKQTRPQDQIQRYAVIKNDDRSLKTYPDFIMNYDDDLNDQDEDEENNSFSDSDYGHKDTTPIQTFSSGVDTVSNDVSSMKNSRTRTRICKYVLTDEQKSALQRMKDSEEKEGQAYAEMEAARLRYETARTNLANVKANSLKLAESVKLVLLEEPCYWNLRFRELQEYKRIHGNCKVARDTSGKLCSKNDHIRKLGVWVGLQRRLYRKNPKQIRKDRILLLNHLGFDWEPVETLWNEKFFQLKNWKKNYGHTRVPCSGRSKELSKWVRRQQGLFRHLNEKKSKKVRTSRDNEESLVKTRMKRLQSINFEWNEYQSNFDEGYAQLVKFKAKFGHVNVPNYYEDDPHLSHWIKTMRKAFHDYGANQSNFLTLERVNRLRTLGFCLSEEKS